jgi:hypothetical protein
MGGQLQTRVARDAQGVLVVQVSGAIDEDTDLEPLARQLAGPVKFHLAGVHRMNSIGALRWTRFMELVTLSTPAVVEALSYPLVMQANCVANFMGRAQVRSCMAPYFCAACRLSCEIEVTRADLLTASGVAPAQRCPRCGGTLDFDELDSYFALLRRTA